MTVFLSFDVSGAEANFVLQIRTLEKYPVDIYYLVDVSASMQKNIEKLNSAGFDLSQKMENISLDLRLGFGSYVDKTVSPYISIHPGRINNQCRYVMLNTQLYLQIQGVKHPVPKQTIFFLNL